ncbi:ComF family protein [Acaryochloris sp. IP29b_bin.148]|uniref:ComF family protein n=1 Tax=Acaryochloris sp. IP29b_bin.148 TaxID=2969218 RepID=UPI0026059D1D|nr:ComF family protein [Acaryochloris sp. IP29b_bin.148]
MSLQWGKLLLSQIRQLSFKPQCAMCERSALDILCTDCRHQLEDCRNLASVMRDDDLRLLAWGQYQGFLRQALAQLKYSQKAKIAQFLGLQLGLAWLETQPHSFRPVVLPIPLHRVREEKRGYNQATLIAREFCHVTGLTLTAHGLFRVRETTAQFNLTPSERFANVAQAFSVASQFSHQINRKPILLLDDIYTTGATVYAATQTLRDAGLQVVGVAVIAKA